MSFWSREGGLERIWGFAEEEWEEETRASERVRDGEPVLTELVAAAGLTHYLIVYCLMLTVITACLLYFIHTE